MELFFICNDNTQHAEECLGIVIVGNANANSLLEGGILPAPKINLFLIIAVILVYLKFDGDLIRTKPITLAIVLHQDR